MEIKFIADVHMGKLAKMLRMLDIDTAFKNNYTNQQLAAIAVKEQRILLSRNAGFLKNKEIQCWIIFTEQPTEQLQQLIKHFNLKSHFKPFTRCMACNGNLKPVEKEKVFNILEKNTAIYYSEFWQCNNCNKIYWKGSHYKRMQNLIKKIIEE